MYLTKIKFFYLNNNVYLLRKYARYFPTDMIICSEKRKVFREHSSRKTVSFKEQIMSKEKYLSIFSPQMEAIVFIILQIFFCNPRKFENWGIFSVIPQFYLGNIWSRDVFRPIASEQEHLMDYKPV